MSKSVDFRLNLSGLNALMKSGEMQSILNGAAQQLQSSLGEGYEIETAHPINFIAIASVRAASYKAKLDNNKSNTLLKGLGGTRI